MERRFMVSIAAAGASIVSGCGGYNNARGIGDAPVGEVHEAPREVWNNIDKFPNIAAFCIGANGVYTHTREAAPVVVPNDPNCAVGGELTAQEVQSTTTLG